MPTAASGTRTRFDGACASSVAPMIQRVDPQRRTFIPVLERFGRAGQVSLGSVDTNLVLALGPTHMER